MGIQPIYGESWWYFNWDWLGLWALQILPTKGSKIRMFVSSGSPIRIVPEWAGFVGYDLDHGKAWMKLKRSWPWSCQGQVHLGIVFWAAESLGVYRVFGYAPICSDLAMDKNITHFIDDLQYLLNYNGDVRSPERDKSGFFQCPFTGPCWRNFADSTVYATATLQ